MTNTHWVYRTDPTTNIDNLTIEDFKLMTSGNSVARELTELVDKIQGNVLVINHDAWTTPEQLVVIFKKIINAAKQYIEFSKVLIDSSIDPVDYYNLADKLNLLAFELRLAKIVLIGGFKEIRFKRSIVLPTSYWYFKTYKITYNRYSQALNEGIDLDRMSHYRSREFSCLNRALRDHRLILYSMLKKRKLLDSFIYGAHDRDAHDPSNRHVADRLPSTRIIHHSDPWWERVKTDVYDFPISWPGQITGPNDHGITHPAYYDAYCNVVTETHMDREFASEKIWKPIAAGQLFLVAGSKGTCEWLEAMGFYTFEKELYDDEPDPLVRLTKIVDIIASKKGNVKQWWIDNYPKIKHNRDRFYSSKFYNQVIKHVAKAF